MKVTDLYKRPFESASIGEDDFIPVEKLIDQDIVVVDVETFENDKGPGAYLLFKLAGDEALHYTTTHSVNIVGLVGREEVRKGLNEGDFLETRIIRRPSKTDKTKTVFTLA